MVVVVVMLVVGGLVIVYRGRGGEWTKWHATGMKWIGNKYILCISINIISEYLGRKKIELIP